MGVASSTDSKRNVVSLYAIGVSHYCESARWALQAAGTPFVESGALPGLHRVIFPSKQGDPDKVTPYLKTSSGEIIGSSWDILAWCSRGTVPDDVKLCLDESIGPAVRSIFYSFALKHESFDKVVEQAPVAQRLLWGVAGGKIKQILFEMMVRDEEYVAEQKQKLDAGWKHMETRLKAADNPFVMAEDGAPSGACIALCSIAGAILFPENQFYGGTWKPSKMEDVPEGLKEFAEKYRNTDLGQFILDVYKDNRIPKKEK